MCHAERGQGGTASEKQLLREKEGPSRWKDSWESLLEHSCLNLDSKNQKKSFRLYVIDYSTLQIWRTDELLFWDYEDFHEIIRRYEDQE